MKKFFNWVIVLGACVGAFYLIGLIVPRNQTLGSKTNMQTKPKDVYALIADVGTWPSWNPDVATVVERPERNGHAIWLVTDPRGVSHDLEVVAAQEPAMWHCTYTIDGTRFTLRFDLNWYGEGARVRVSRTADTRDPWERAKRFLWTPEEAGPLELLNALGEHFGESTKAEKN